MKLSTAQQAALLTALRDLLHYGPRKPNLGICWHLDKMVVQGAELVHTYTFVATVSVDWPGLTGEVHEDFNGPMCNYPIKRVPRDYCGLWEGEQLTQRTALIQFLIGYLEGL